MRIRNNPRALEIIRQYDETVLFRPEKNKGNWSRLFPKKIGNEAGTPIHVELGMGRGKFISEMGSQNRSIGFIGIDLRHEIILCALRNVMDKGLSNVLLLPYNILDIESIFEVSEVDCFYINFCDPWPKVRHSKRRLTHRLFLEKYKKLLREGGRIEFKTDCRELFDFSINEFRESGFEIVDLTYDLHGEEYPDNITTEYEEKFIDKGIKINKLEAVKKRP